LSGNVDEGLGLIRSVVRKHPDDFTVRQRLIEACVRGGRLDQAVQEFSELTRVTPNFPQVHFDALARAGSFLPIELRHAFERATVASPTDAIAWYGLGLLHQLTNDQDEAANAFKQGIAADQHHALLHYNLGVALMDDPNQAELFLRDAIKYNSKMAEPHYALGTLYLDRDQKRAAAHFLTFIQLAPPHLQTFTTNARATLEVIGGQP
jgi:Flp pilus assembly protein TadD